MSQSILWEFDHCHGVVWAAEAHVKHAAAEGGSVMCHEVNYGTLVTGVVWQQKLM